MGGLLGIFIVPVRAMVALMAVASVSLMAVTVAQRGEAPFDPFAEYTDILLEQSWGAALQRGFECSSVYTSYLLHSCVLLNSGIFSDIKVEITSNWGQISGMIFTPREKMLTLGDLVLLWGKPEITVYAGIANLRWRDMNVVAIPQTYDGHLSYWLPIRYVAFEGDD